MHVHHKKNFFMLLLILTAFCAFFVFLIYMGKRKLFIPPAPATSYCITPDSVAGPNAWLYSFENCQGNPDVTDAVAHTGNHAAVATGRLSYSTVITRPVPEDMGNTKWWIALSGWVFIKDNEPGADAQLVAAITGKRKQERYSASIRIQGNAVPLNKWFKVSGKFEVPGLDIAPGDRLRVFLWNRRSAAIFIDDVLIVTGKTENRTTTAGS